MIVIGLDTSGDDLLLGLAIDNQVAVTRLIPAFRRHAELLPGVIIDLLNERQLDLTAATGFAIIAGPGSYTGLRVGAATIMGLAVPNRIPTVAISTFSYWRLLYQTEDRPLCCVIPCRGQLYYSCKYARGQTITTEPVEVLSASEIISQLHGPYRVVGAKTEDLKNAVSPDKTNIEILTGPPTDAAGRLALWGDPKIAAGDVIDWDTWHPDYGPLPEFRTWSPPPR